MRCVGRVHINLEGGAQASQTRCTMTAGLDQRARSYLLFYKRLTSPAARDLRELLVHIAVETSDVHSLQALCDAGVDTNFPMQESGATPLCIACFHGRVACMRVLLDTGTCALNQAAHDGITPLLMACHQGRSACVRLLCEAGADANLCAADRFEAGTTPLYISCRLGHIQCARLLLNAGAAMDRPVGPNRVTPLHVACNDGHAPVVQLLCDARAAPNLGASNGSTPLLTASGEGHVVCTRLLLAAGAVVNQASDNGVTPLLTACYSNRPECARLLCAAGAHVDLADGDATTPLLVATLNGNVECMRVLCDAGADTNCARANGITPLLTACAEGRADCARVLLECDVRECDVDLAGGNSASPLLLACTWGNFECVRLLSSFGASREAIPGLGTPEAAAARGEHTELLAWLRRSRDWTPLHHLEELTVARARSLLRDGATLHGGLSWVPSPLQRAQQNSTGDAVAALLLRAQGWTVHSHDLFPAAARARAVELLRLGYQIACSHTEQHASSLVDAWRDYVLPHALTRWTRWWGR